MSNEYTERKQSMSLKWIKADSGNSYLCSAEALAKMDNPTEEDLKRVCVDESANPQND